MAATTGKKGSKISFTEEINATVNPIVEEAKTSAPEKVEEKNKGGRPSSGEVKKLSLAIPVELFDGVETGAALFFKGNKTAYINALIKKDLEENLEKYKEFKEMSMSKRK
jgi:hypothetical protein